MEPVHYDPEKSMYTPEQFIDLSRLRRAIICEQIRNLRYEYDDLLAEEVRVRVEIAVGGDYGITQTIN